MPTEERLRSLRSEDDAVDRADAIMVEAAEHRVRVGNKAALAALERLANWKPECGFPRNITRAYGRDGTPWRELQDVPFCTEVYTYEVWGKEDARTFLALLNSVARALGVRDGIRDLRSADDD